jgi:hypothetical protein
MMKECVARMLCCKKDPAQGDQEDRKEPGIAQITTNSAKGIECRQVWDGCIVGLWVL